MAIVCCQRSISKNVNKSKKDDLAETSVFCIIALMAAKHPKNDRKAMETAAKMSM